MLAKDLRIGDFVSYEIIFDKKRYRYPAKVLSYNNGKASIVTFSERDGLLRKLWVRITDLQPLLPEQYEKLTGIQWDNLSVELLTGPNKIEILRDRMHTVH